MAAENGRVDVTAGVRAAGGVLGRRSRAGREVLLVHRPRYQDWSLPKGKLKRAEHPVSAAVREVREETGVRGVVGARLPSARYQVRSGPAPVTKHVDYWAMTPVDPQAPLAAESVDEVDDLAWTPARRAMELLSYPHDRQVLRAYLDLPELRPPVLLIRHARAGDRRQHRGADGERPLDDRGLRQAEALAALLPLYGVSRLVSAQPLRCQQTLQPAARSLSLDMEIESCFNDDTDPADAARALRRLAGAGVATAVCSQGELIPRALVSLGAGRAARVDHTRTPDGDAFRVAKGAGWVLHFGRSARELRVVDPLTLA